MNNNKGNALLIAIFLSVIIVILAATGSQLIVTSHKETSIQEKALTEADNAARAGLTDAVSWFKRQIVQPVKSGVPPTAYSYPDGAFDPKYDADPEKSDTIDESIGIVKEYPISSDGLKWARYEVRRQKDTATYAYDPHAVHDVTSQRIDGGQDGEGWVWYIESAGYVYKRVDPTKAFNVSPNAVLGKVRASTEVRRISLSLPVQAATLSYNMGPPNNGRVIIWNKGRIIAENNIPATAGVIGRKKPFVKSGGYVSSPQYVQYSDDLTLYRVFSEDSESLKLLSDYLVSSVDELPLELPTMTFIYIDGNATFTASHPLRGSGLLVVDGNLNIEKNSNSMFSGFIYVTGDAYIREPALISGSMTVREKLELSSTDALDIAQIEYDANIINSVRTLICQYRENKSTLHVFIGVPGLESN